jgi:hypothetical protein
LGWHKPHHLVQAGRLAHEGHQQQRTRLEPSQRLSQSGDFRSVRLFLRLQVREGLQAPLGLSTDTQKSAFGAGLRGPQKGQQGLLKPLAHARAEGLKLLE